MTTARPYQAPAPTENPGADFRTPLSGPLALPETGYCELDETHAKLSANLAELRKALADGAMPEAMRCSVTLLFELREDYALEEALMFRSDYPDQARHQAAHAVLEQTFSQLSRSIRDALSGSPNQESGAAMIALLDTGHRMLAAHVLGADVALTRFVLALDEKGRAA